MIFFPLVVVIFIIIPKRLRCIWLLIASYYFYMSWNPRYAVLIAFSTLATYLSGILLEKAGSQGSKKAVVAASFLCNLSILAIFKYADFALDTLGALLLRAGISFTDRRLDLLLPVGISFYTFQALGYTMDVYRGTIKAEKNLLNYALFVSFFPQLVAGPIERSGNLLLQIKQIKEIKAFDPDRIRNGLTLMSWGLFQKLVIADRASICVNNIYKNYTDYSGIELSIAAILFTFQIYCDFSGYTNIARGAASVMGFQLMDNFRQPYLSTNMVDYWRRWHISLTSWFRDYLYFPLGGSRKGTLRKYINIIIVFSVSGLWHGASMHFVAWGLVNALLQIAHYLKESLLHVVMKLPEKDGVLLRILRTCITFMLICMTFIFFSSSSIRMALDILYRIFTRPVTFMFSGFGIDSRDCIVLIMALLILLIVDMIHESGISITGYINKRPLWIKYVLYTGMIWSLILFGIYGTGYDTGQFIYFQF